ncbi:hypothetical protein PV327_001807 [Microctonus hyperodae]|uniref:Uncharacterized protein n=1 Tax=Microctonus hyperodae TaxID=165561 RepID=A0AA39FEM6_MICHY|nr:hypothetical protein PV327_001807 [Microctonus hyperodae]
MVYLKNKKSGQRRRLVKNLLNLEAIQQTMDELDLSANPTICYSSEYIENFCNSPLSLSVENDEMYKKYPLYGGPTQTIYNQLIMEGAIKSRSAITNINTPFRRNSIISSLLEDNLN